MEDYNNSPGKSCWESMEKLSCLINNLVSALKQCNQDIQERMIRHLTQRDREYGRRVAEGLGRNVEKPVADSAVAH